MKTINEILSGGCKPGELVVLFANPSTGKSIWKELQMAKCLAEADSQQPSNENDDG
jgi:hypothetical protein